MWCFLRHTSSSDLIYLVLEYHLDMRDLVTIALSLWLYFCDKEERWAEWLSSWLTEQEDRGSIPGLATWIFRDWLSPASKSRYGWKDRLIDVNPQNNQPTSVTCSMKMEYTCVSRPACLFRPATFWRRSARGCRKRRWARRDRRDRTPGRAGRPGRPRRDRRKSMGFVIRNTCNTFCTVRQSIPTLKSFLEVTVQ